MSDPLTEIVTLLRPRAVLVTEIRGRGCWGIDFPAFHVTNFAIAAEGDCWLRLGDDDCRPFQKGDFLLQPSSMAFGFSSEPGAPRVFGDAAYKAAAGSLINLGASGGTATRIVGGYVEVDGLNSDLFATLLPRVVHVQAHDRGADRLAMLLSLIDEEAREHQAGRALVLQRLAEILIVEALRRPVVGELVASRGILAGLRDRHLAQALQAIHAEVQGSWTLVRLAGLAGMSRSAFARRFQEIIGMTPMAYIIAWRMAVAKSLLINEHLMLEEVAERTGYGSASAFSHAFLRAVGCTPSAFKQHRSLAEAAAIASAE